MKSFFLSLICLAFSFNAFPQTLHAILVSDVEDPKLGGVSLRDEEKILKILKTAEKYTGLTLAVTYHNRDTFTASAVRETLQELPTKANDVVFFYYSGGGYYASSGSRFPSFTMKENFLQPIFNIFNYNMPLSLDEVSTIVQKKGGRLNIVMADCRDATQPPLYINWNPELGSAADEDIKAVALKKLFLGSCGLVKVASAREGQKVWAEANGKPPGSLYTEKFYRAFEEMLETRFAGVRAASWQQLTVFDGVRPANPWRIMTDSELTNAISNDPASERKYERIVVQHPRVEIRSGTEAQRRNTARYPSYRYAMTSYDIGQELLGYRFMRINSLSTNPRQAKPILEKVQKKYEKLRHEIPRAFLPNATITLIRRNGYPANDPRAKKTSQEMSITAYLEEFKKEADRMAEVVVDVSSIKRTPDKEYLTNLTIVEIYDEM